MDTSITEDTANKRHCHCCKRPDIETDNTPSNLNLVWWNLRGLDNGVSATGMKVTGLILKRGSLLCRECLTMFDSF